LLTFLLLVAAAGLFVYALFMLAPGPSAQVAQSLDTRFAGIRELRPLALLENRERMIPWVLFLVALCVRLMFLDSIPNTVTADELDYARDQLATMHGIGPGFFGLDWTQQPAMSMYFRTWTWQLLGPTLFNLRLVSAVVTSLAVFPFYWLTRRRVSVEAACAGTILLSSAWWLLLFGRSGWNNGDIVTYMLWAAWALTAALERKRPIHWILFGVALALLLYGYVAGRAVVLGFAIYFPILLVQCIRARERGGWQNVVNGAFLAASVCFVLFLPELRVILQDPNRFNTRVQAASILAHPPPGESNLEIFKHQFSVTFNSFFQMDRSTGGRYKGLGMAWLDSITALFYFVGLAVGLVRLRSTVLWWLLLLVPLAITQLLTIDIPSGARAIPAIAPMCFFAAVGIDFLLRLGRKVQLFSQLALVVLTLAAATMNIHDFVQWVDSPTSMSERQPAVPSDAFNTWREFQEARLQANLPMLNADEYTALPASAIAAQIVKSRGNR
jgi:4-amino-4-deoxy-L-arabinose transferase-like glycosyltransferase